MHIVHHDGIYMGRTRAPPCTHVCGLVDILSLNNIFYRYTDAM